MSYEKTVWRNNDIITASKLNKIENGIAGAGNNAVVQFSVTGYSTVTNTYGYIVYGIYDAQNSRWVIERDDSAYWNAILGFANEAPNIIPPYFTIIPNDNVGLFFIPYDNESSVSVTGDIASESSLYYSYGSLIPYDVYRITGDGSISVVV